MAQTSTKEGAAMLTPITADERNYKIKARLSRGYRVDYGRANMYPAEDRNLFDFQVTVYASLSHPLDRYEVQLMTGLAPEERPYDFVTQNFNDMWLPKDAVAEGMTITQIAEALYYRFLAWYNAR